MVLDIDTQYALRGVADLGKLIDAVVAADPHDEADWIEWKSNLDLSGKHGWFAVARTVLGLANRMPDRANTTCEGLGYLVVGAEPGTVAGVTAVDPADLNQGIELYVGSDGPRWTPTYVSHRGRTVLVVLVEAPRNGDPIYPLRKTFDSARSGTIFVRGHGVTRPADADDLDALQRRLAAGRGTRPDLDVEVVGDVPLSWFSPDAIQAGVEAWASRRRDALVRRARRVEKARHEPVELDLDNPGGIGSKLAAMSAYRGTSFMEKPDPRTLDDYIAEVDKWTERLSKEALSGLPAAYVDRGHGVIAIRVENKSGRFLSDVEVEVKFEQEWIRGSEEKFEHLRLPSPPREFGKPVPLMGEAFPGLVPSDLLGSTYALPDVGRIARRTTVEDGSVKIVFTVGDLRPHASDQGEEVYVFVNERPEGGILHGTWRATMRELDGLLTGDIEVQLADAPVSLAELLDQQGTG